MDELGLSSRLFDSGCDPSRCKRVNNFNLRWIDIMKQALHDEHLDLLINIIDSYSHAFALILCFCFWFCFRDTVVKNNDGGSLTMSPCQKKKEDEDGLYMVMKNNDCEPSKSVSASTWKKMKKRNSSSILYSVKRIV